MKEQYTRTALLFGDEAVEKLKGSRVAVFGLGGVGGAAVEALARAGVGTLELIDSDKVSESNINRQIIALHSTVGRDKTEVCAERIADIDP
ncbi:MAG: ThiF family adenylyltransferase, partial [Clostridia bacterium]|nr:ThiF family adenylyltransferase [Clostridia bacterium]